jgi:DNA invertase Pin-like site-specific DNA recombinase
MKARSIKPVRCAIYTRVSTEHGLDQEFNSLDAQYEAASAYIKSQAHAGWTLIRSRYDDGGYSGGSTDRPDLQRLLEDSHLSWIAPCLRQFGRNPSLNGPTAPPYATSPTTC